MKKKLIVGNTLIALTALYVLVNPIKSMAATQEPAALWQEVAQKLGIGTDKVQTAFEQIREERKKERVTQLVKDGKLTQVQANALALKQKEWQTKAQALKADRDAWFKSQNIDQTVLRGQMHGRGSRVQGMMKGNM